jgi:acyl-CoA hydrolase
MNLEEIKGRYPKKFASENEIFNHIHRGDGIFIGTACGEPQYLVNALINYISSHPKAFFDAEVFHVWTLGVAPYTDEKFQHNFRHNSFFIGKNTRAAVNEGLADYTPISLSGVPELFRRKLIPVDVALIQTSPPDMNGYMSLGVSVDITKAATESARLVIAQVNSYMPRVHGDTFININDVDFVIPNDEPLLEYEEKISDDIAKRIGKYVVHGSLKTGTPYRSVMEASPMVSYQTFVTKSIWGYTLSCYRMGLFSSSRMGSLTIPTKASIAAKPWRASAWVKRRPMNTSMITRA